MAELATIARPYAEALFEASLADLNGAATWLNPLSQLCGNAQLVEFAANPQTTDAQVLELVCGLLKPAVPPAAKNFLSLIIENGRLNVMPEIATQFRALQNERNSCADAVVYSAFALDAAALEDLRVTLEKRFARKLNLSVQVDASLIGGVRVVVGDQVLDTSVKARLEQMKVALTA